jgi:hypothetical protein
MDLRTANRRLATLALQLWFIFLRQEIKLTSIYLIWLRRRNQRSTASVVSGTGPVVSVTSHGERLHTVHLALESIAAGSVLPSRLILWVDTPDAFSNRSPGLKRLVDRGLEIYLSDNFGPHTKYYPYLLSTDSFDSPLVTADDDILYSRWWLKGLVRSHCENPGVVNCYRADFMRLERGAITPYRTWGPCKSTYPGYLNFATGVSGCIYPPALLIKLRRAGSEFMHLCPKADDVWLHVNTIRAGIKIRQIWSRPLRFPIIPGTARYGLYHSNVLLARNDEQIRNTYGSGDIALLQSAAAHAYRQ